MKRGDWGRGGFSKWSLFLSVQPRSFQDESVEDYIWVNGAKSIRGELCSLLVCYSALCSALSETYNRPHLTCYEDAEQLVGINNSSSLRSKY